MWIYVSSSSMDWSRCVSDGRMRGNGPNSNGLTCGCVVRERVMILREELRGADNDCVELTLTAEGWPRNEEPEV